MANFVGRLWRRVFSSRLLTLNGYVAFNLPRTVTAVGESLLVGLVATHLYLLLSEPSLPVYFIVYVGALTVGCVSAVVAMVGMKPAALEDGWYLGSAVCSMFLVIYLVSRIDSLPDLEALTGRWDVAPATLAAALAAGYIGVHATVLSGINVAYPRTQGWQD